MLINPEFQFRTGYEGFFAVSSEANFLGIGESIVAAAPAEFVLAGYTDVPNMATSFGPQGIEAAASFRDVAIVQGAVLPSMRGNITCTAPQNGVMPIMASALRSGYNGETHAEAGLNTHYGLPVVCAAGGALDLVEADRAYTKMARYGLLNSCNFTASEGQPLKSSVDLWPLCFQDQPAMFLEDVAPTLGTVLTWHELDLTIAGVSFRPVIQSISIGINNQLRRVGLRPNYKGTGVTGTFRGSKELSRCPYDIQPGIEKLSLSISTHSRLLGLEDVNLANISLKAYGLYGNSTVEFFINIANAYLSETTQQGGQPGSPFQYSGQFYAVGITMGANYST